MNAPAHEPSPGFAAPPSRGIRNIPDGLFTRCPACRQTQYSKQLEAQFYVCPGCEYHFRLSAQDWLSLLDPDSFEEQDADLASIDRLRFTTPQGTYAAKLAETRQRTGLLSVVISGSGTINAQPLVLTACEFDFIGGSMGYVFGEKIARAAERAAELGCPLLTINCSGGARMQEGIIALMQMAKVSVALTRLAAAGQPHIALLVDPCYGGVAASYASVADIIIAEPGASIGFAGKRVIEQTIRQQLPDNFQTAEFLLQRGMIDMVVPRLELRAVLARILRLFRRAAQRPPAARARGEAILSGYGLAPQAATESLGAARERRPAYATDVVEL